MDKYNDLHINGQSIKIRLTQDMKKWLFEKKAREGTAVSDIIRGLIGAEMEKERKNNQYGSAIESAMTRTDDTEGGRTAHELLRRAAKSWEVIRICELKNFNLTFDELRKQCEEKKNILFLSDDEMEICENAKAMREIVKVLGAQND